MIEFARPLGLLALALIPLVWMWLRLPARSMPSDRVELWRRALARLARRRKLAVAWQGLVLVVAIAAFSAALAGVRIPERDGLRQRITVVDASTSMFAEDVDGASRLRSALSDWARTRPPSHVEDKLYALTGQRLARIDQPSSARRSGDDWSADEVVARVARARDARPVEARTPARLEVAQRIFDAAGGRARCVVASDGAGESAWPSFAADVVVRGYGSQRPENARITELSLEDPWPGPELTLRLTIEGPRSGAALELRRAGEKSATLAIPESGPVELRLVRGAGGDLELALRPRDVLELDGSVKLRLRAPWSPAMILRGADAKTKAARALDVLARFCRRALGARVVGGENMESFARRALARAGGLVLQSGSSMPAWPEDSIVRVLFGTRLPGLGERRRVDGLPRWDRSRELLRGLDVGALAASRGDAPRSITSGRGALPSDAERLVDVDGLPFIVRSRKHRVLWFGAELGDALVQSPALPLLLLRALPALLPGRGGQARAEASQVLESPGAEARASIAARPAPASARDAPVWWREAVELWQYALALAALALLVLALL